MKVPIINQIIHKNYAPDEMVRMLQNSRKHAQVVYFKGECDEEFYGILDIVDPIIEDLSKIMSIKANIYFAVVGGGSPFRVTHLGKDEFAVLIDERAFYYLMRLCLRIQSLNPLAECLCVNPIEENNDYKGKFLLDIVKDIIFHYKEDDVLMDKNSCPDVYFAVFSFIIGHEICHISHGHLEFLESEDFLNFCINEEDKLLTLRTLEMDADSTATSAVFDFFEMQLMKAIQNDKFPKNVSMLGFRHRLYKRGLAGIYIALLGMDGFSSSYVPKAYPIGYARFLTAVGVADIILSKWPPLVDIPELIRNKLVESFVELNGSFNSLRHPIASNVVCYEGDDISIGRAEYNPLGIASGLAHLEPLYCRWSRLRPVLEKYQRGGGLAPAIAPPF